jgi:hypothetical protein
MHGRLPFTPSRVTAYGEDWERGEPLLFCEGEIMQFRFQGEALRLRRRIEVPVAGNLLRIRDIVENLGNEDTPQASLYHINFGYPALAVGSQVTLGERRLVAINALPDLSATSESASYPSDGNGPLAVCKLMTPQGNGQTLEVAVTFATDTLRHLQLWYDLRPNACVLAIEPCTSAKVSGLETILRPGETRAYAVDISVAQR